MLTPLLLAASFALLQGHDSATATGYRIVAALAADRAELTSRAVLRVDRAAFGSTDSMRISLGGPGTHRLRLTQSPLIDGQATPFRLAADSTELVLPRGAGAEVAITLEYRITMDTTGRRQLGYDLFGATEPADSWYPVLRGVPDSLGRFKTFDVDLEVPAGVALLTSGTVIDSVIGQASVRRRYHGDHLEGFALAMGPGYSIRSRRAGGVVVRVFAPSGDSLIWDRVGAETAKAVTWYQDTYGFFPVADIGIVPGSLRSRGGFPLPNMFMIHQGDLSPGFVGWITSHELAHYYWGLYVLSSTERLDWLMLGLGIWTDQWYLAQTGGLRLEAQWRSPRADNSFEDFATASIAGYDQRLGLPEAEAESLEYDYNSLVRHGKGSIALYLMSLRLGPDRFVALQRSILHDFRYAALSPGAFAQLLERTGVGGAPKFLQAWVRGDARLDYAIRGVRADAGQPGAYWIQIERTGTIPYPVTIEARPASGPVVRVELTGEPSLDSVRVVLGARLDRVDIDPDGLLPMASSANLDMRRVFLRAMGAVGPVESFLALSRSHLSADPDPLVAALVIERLFELGRYGEIERFARGQAFVTRCLDRATCSAAVQVARAEIRVGARTEASALLSRLDVEMSALGFGSSRRLAQAHGEARPSP